MRRRARTPLTLAALWLTLLCAAPPALADGTRAADGVLMLGPSTRQAAADLNFEAPPRWDTPAKCIALDARDSCLLAKMTAEPEGVPPSEIVATALRLAGNFDKMHDDKADGFPKLRAAQAYLVAGVYEIRGSHLDDARKDFALAIERARDVPKMLTSFSQTVQAKPNPDRYQQLHVLIGTSAQDTRNSFFQPADLVREYAIRALSNLRA
jgi:hypothetical protein